ncbi:hypothetical protein C0992_000789 [Termitomyces sp. T32_za158]|nr:hypothetical protein C0992_000789 [Termitomyces sp. T32_za158]
MPRRSARLASSAAVRTSPSADLESLNTDATVENHGISLDTGPTGQECVRPQKHRKQSKLNVPSLHPSLQPKDVRGRRGALKDIVEMPLDILLEIFMYLTPVEILSLSRACKSLRQILMTKKAGYVWKQARINLDDFPDCPDDLNEPQFANLIFAALCDVDWIQEHTDERKRRIAHGRLCERWLEKQADERAAELDKIRTRRYKAMKQKLTNLGWEEDLKTSEGMESRPSIRQPKDLTNRVWQNIKDDIIKNMEEHRGHRLKRHHLNAQYVRIGLLESSFHGVREKHWGQTILPDIADLIATEPISTLIKAPTEETIRFPESVIFDAARNWRASCDVVLRNMVLASTAWTSGSTGVNPVLLATTFFSCSRNSYGCNELQYPEVLKHKCATASAISDGFPHRNAEKVSFSDKAYSLAKVILEAAGFNPDTTRREDVQWPAFIIKCQHCSNLTSGRGGRRLMSWPVAIQHAQRHDKAGEHLQMSRANLTGVEGESVRNLAADHFNDKYMDHIQQKHKGPLQFDQLIYSTNYTSGIKIFGFGPQPDGEIFLKPGYARETYR